MDVVTATIRWHVLHVIKYNIDSQRIYRISMTMMVQLVVIIYHAISFLHKNSVRIIHEEMFDSIGIDDYYQYLKLYYY